MSSPHNKAEKGEIASIVLMPGDPLRAKKIAETYLSNVVQFNDVRNMFGYTGTYKGKRISVMGSGMGMPSIGIYSYELYSQYGVEKIIRIGSAGSYVPELEVYDVLLVSSAFSESSYALTAFNFPENIQYPSAPLNAALAKAAKHLNIPIKEGIIHSSDVFYHGDHIDVWPMIAQNKLMAVEMESFALFANARYLNKQAACLLTISDSLITHQITSPEERQNSFTKMMEIALELALEN